MNITQTPLPPNPSSDVVSQKAQLNPIVTPEWIAEQQGLMERISELIVRCETKIDSYKEKEAELAQKIAEKGIDPNHAEQELERLAQEINAMVDEIQKADPKQVLQQLGFDVSLS